MVKGQQIRGDQSFRQKLASGDIFRMGDEYGTWITLIYDDGTGAPLEKPTELQPIALTADTLSIGRTPDNTATSLKNSSNGASMKCSKMWR